MTDLLLSFFADLLYAAVGSFDTALLGILNGMLRVENMFDSAVSAIITSGTIGDLYNFIYLFVTTLVILKFLYKGFNIYILWRDGDADSSPQDMVVGAAEAAVVMVGFPFLYNIMANVTSWFANGIMTTFGLADSEEFPFSSFVSSVLTGQSIFLVIMALIYIVMALLLCVKLIQRGFELLVLRLGVPFACMGLVDSDLGIFTSYMQTFFKTLITSVIQITLLSLSLRVMLSMTFINLVCAIALITTAFSTPTLMQQVLIPTGRGGGVINKIYTGSMAVRAFRGFIGK